MKRLFSKFIVLTLLLNTQLTFAFVSAGENAYYGAALYQDLRSGLRDRALAVRLNEILKSGHRANADDYDTLASECQGPDCKMHTSLGYNRARQYMMGEFYLIKNEDGTYGMRDMYCDRNVGPADYPKGDLPRPGEIPDGNIINTEHTWPQSKFTEKYSKDMQKSDLHHLFPTDNQMNAVRGNYPFGEVVAPTKSLKCNNVLFGKSDLGEEKTFEPPEWHKGNVARALFYFSVRYEVDIDENQEKTLRLWNQLDPVDEEEARLNNRIHEIQHTRNPFVDHSEWVQLISDF